MAALPVESTEVCDISDTVLCREDGWWTDIVLLSYSLRNVVVNCDEESCESSLSSSMSLHMPSMVSRSKSMPTLIEVAARLALLAIFTYYY